MIGRNKVRASTQDVVTFQWANGKSMARATIGTGRFVPYVGFHIEAGRDTSLDEACQFAKVAQIEIKHQRQGGAEIVRHWSFGEQTRFYPITSGPVATSIAGSLGRNARATAEAGIGLRWGQGERSKMAIRGYLDVLARAGVVRLVQLSVRSRMSDMLLAALVDHVRVCEAADALIDRSKHPDVVCLHEVALIFGAGDEQEWGKGDTATVVPLVSRHPAEITNEYLRTIWRPDTIQAAALRDWEGIQQWAQEYATQSEEASGRQLEEVAVNGGYDDPL